jgi:hypothetical protein
MALKALKGLIMHSRAVKGPGVTALVIYWDDFWGIFVMGLIKPLKNHIRPLKGQDPLGPQQGPGPSIYF